MHVTIPDDIASYLHEHWGEYLPRRVLESLALEAYREPLIGEARLQRWLGFASTPGSSCLPEEARRPPQLYP